MNNIYTFFRETSTGRFFIPAGLILIIFSIFLFIATDHNKNYIKTEAVVSRTELVEEAYTDADGNRVDATYKVYVKYTVDGQEYDEELGELPNYKQGDKITICYNPENPSQISQPTTIILPIALLVAGIAALIGGIVSIMKALKKHKAMKEQEKGWANAN